MKINMELDDKLHKRLRKKAIDEDTTQVKLIHQYVKEGLDNAQK